MANVSKIVYDGQTIIDLTGDTVSESSLVKGYTAHSNDGRKITGILDVFDMESAEDRVYADFSVSDETLTLSTVTGTNPNKMLTFIWDP